MSSSLLSTIMISLLLLSILPAFVVILESKGGNIFLQSAYGQLSGVTPVVDETIRPSSIVLMNIEYLPTKEKAGDAETNPNSLQLVTQNDGEECCYKIQYAPGPVGKAGIAYKTDKNYDLADAKRVVFFAMGEKGGEKVSFLAAGKDAGVSIDIFKNKTFAAITQDIILTKDWRRYEMNVEGIDLIGVTYPFAFIVNKGQDLGTVIFSLKGVTYDSKAATNPVSLQETANESSFSSTRIPTTTESNGTNTNGTERLAVAGQESDGNSTTSNGDLGPNNLNEDFKDSTNNNTSSAGGELLLPQPSNLTTLTTNNTANHTDINTPAAADYKTRPTSMPRATTFTSAIQPEPMDNNTITSSGNVDPTTTSSEAPTIPNLDPHSLDTDIGNNIISYGGSNIATPSLNDDDQTLSIAADQQYSYNDNQTSYGETGSQSTRPISPNTFAEYQNNARLTASDTTQQGVGGANNRNAGVLENGNIGAAPSIGTTTTTLPQQYQVPPLTQQYQVPPLTASNTQQGEVNAANNAAAVATLQLHGSTLVVPPSASASSPPDTAITSAIDSSTGLDIQNGGTSLSSSIIFSFRDTDYLDIAGYVCSIDGLPVFACSSPVIIDRNILHAAGVSSEFGHSFQVSTIDTSGDIDPTPAVFDWIAADTILPESIITPETTTPYANVPGTILPETIITPDGLARETTTPYANVPGTILPETIITPETITPNTIESESPALEALTP